VFGRLYRRFKELSDNRPDPRRAGDEWLTRAMAAHDTEAERRTLIEALALLERLTQP
jgi:hypothetical protein